MNGKDAIDLLMALVAVAGVTTVVAHPKSASVIMALGSAFQGSINAATGQTANVKRA